MVQEIFNRKISDLSELEAQQRKKYNLLSYIRAFFAISSVIGLIIFAQYRILEGVVAISVAFPFVFGWLVNRHNKIRFERNHTSFLKRVNEDEIQRAELNLSTFNDGNRYTSAEHPFTTDLDVFGRHSLFQLLNRTSTITGEEKLASWLKEVYPNKEIIKSRQESVKELQPMLEWRQDFQAFGMHFEAPKKESEEMFSWLGSVSDEKEFRLKMPFVILLIVLNLSSLFLVFQFGIPWSLLFIPFGLTLYFLRKVFDELKELMDTTYHSSQVLKTYIHLIRKVQQTEFKSELLSKHHSRFQENGFLAVEEVVRLEKIVDQIQSRMNVFYAIVNILLLTDFRILIKLDKWKERNGDQIIRWFDSLAEIESLCSLAGFAYLNQEYSFPEINTEACSFHGEQLGHPLIKTSKRISNNFDVYGKGQVILITGSNMSGKSTFLRTVGINSVLAFIGAPVCAKTCSMSIFRIYTSMRTTDKLEESVSSFYAELQRIRKLIETIPQSEVPVMYMLDEILKGTNSTDRHKGARALIKQLAGTNSFGFISTHDVELGSANDIPLPVINYSFNSKIVNDTLHFDYKISEGICREFNASVLMKMMGIEGL